MKFHHQTKRPLCEKCGKELVTFEDLPRDTEHADELISEIGLSPLDETNYRQAEKAWCLWCWNDRRGPESFPLVRYVAMPYQAWREEREAVEGEKLRRWNESCAWAKKRDRQHVGGTA